MSNIKEHLGAQRQLFCLRIGGAPETDPTVTDPVFMSDFHWSVNVAQISGGLSLHHVPGSHVNKPL